MPFRSVFIAVVIGTALLVAAFMINQYRPPVATEQPTASFVRASGKCAECHSNQQYSIVHEYELSAHAAEGDQCLDCHRPAERQSSTEHHGFVIATHLTAANCRSCHEAVYEQFLRSRHAAPSWAALYGEKGLTSEQVAFSERYPPPGGQKRAANPLIAFEGPSCGRRRLRKLPCRRPTRRGWDDRQLHRLPHAPHLVCRGGPLAVDMRPVPHGSGPLATRNLHRVQAWCTF